MININESENVASSSEDLAEFVQLPPISIGDPQRVSSAVRAIEALQIEHQKDLSPLSERWTHEEIQAALLIVQKKQGILVQDLSSLSSNSEPKK